MNEDRGPPVGTEGETRKDNSPKGPPQGTTEG